MLAAATSLSHHSDVQIQTTFNPESEASMKVLLSHDLHRLNNSPEFLLSWPEATGLKGSTQSSDEPHGAPPALVCLGKD